MTMDFSSEELQKFGKKLREDIEEKIEKGVLKVGSDRDD